MRILIVEDEILVAMEIASVLEDAGHVSVAHADDLLSAETAADATRPDLALVDIQLAHGDSGIDVAGALKRRGVPVVFVTGNCPLERGRGLALGCLHKPVTDGILIAAVEVAGAAMNGRTLPSLPPTLHLY